MNDVIQTITLAKYQFKNYLRSKRLLTLFLITVSIAVIYLIVLWKYINPSSVGIKDYTSNWVSFLSFLILLSALFFGGDAIAGEYQNKTGYLLFPNPIKRESILWGKFIASFIASSIIVLTYWAVVIGDVYYCYGKLPDALWYSFGFSFLFLLSLLAFSYLFSSFLKNGTIAIVLVAIVYFFVFGIIDGISSLMGFEPWFSITYASKILTLVFSGSYVGDYITKQVIHEGGITITLYNPTIQEGILIMIGYFVLSGILSTIIFKYKELK